MSPGSEMYADPNLDQTLEQAEAVGGRYNPSGEFGVYVSRDQEGVLRELDRRIEKPGIRCENVLPRTLLTLDLRVQKVLDLTDAGVREGWGADVEDLIREDRGSGAPPARRERGRRTKPEAPGRASSAS